MKIVLFQTGKTNEKYIREGIEIYGERIARYTPFDIVTIPDLKNTRNLSPGDQKVMEGEKITGQLRIDDMVIILDERGKEHSTREFSAFLEKAMMMPRKRIVFVIGGPWGFSDEVYRRADVSLSLSKMTFPHQMVRLLFLEQLYRALTILKGDPYHHD
jgi:23S rRNA (pseudouridine1915-N3)-methyltransferase